MNRWLSEILANPRGRVELVVTSLVIREWVQNQDEVCEEATKWLRNAESQIVEVHRAWEKLDRPLASAAPNYDIPDLVQELANLAKSLLRGLAVLKEDAE